MRLLFFGIGSTLIHYFDKKLFNIHSNISSVSGAFVVINETRPDAKFISLHNKQKNPFSFASIASKNKVILLTDLKNNTNSILQPS